MRVLSWNLYHGRDHPPDKALLTLRSRLLRVTERNETHVQVNRPLLDEFAGWLAGREWDVALLQEAPPLWFRELGGRAEANGVRVLTSRNVVPPLQRLARQPEPDLIASWEGGSNQLLRARAGPDPRAPQHDAHAPPGAAADGLGARSAAGGETVCFANLHASAGLPRKAAGELLAAARQRRRLVGRATRSCSAAT